VVVIVIVMVFVFVFVRGWELVRLKLRLAGEVRLVMLIRGCDGGDETVLATCLSRRSQRSQHQYRPRIASVNSDFTYINQRA
jgi:hypothetical protein